MADLSQVRDTIKAIVAAAIYPTGTSNPSAILQGETPVPCQIVAGWPVKDQLAQNLAAGVATVSIWPVNGAERNTSRFARVYTALSNPPPTITATVAADAVTLGGAVSTPQNLAVIAAAQAYLYAVQPGDTLTTIAAALAALIEGASSAGSVVTIPGATDLVARAGGVGTVIRELRRQERLFQVSSWCSTPAQRDAVAPFVDSVLIGAGLPNGREFIALPDGSSGRILYQRSNEIDQDQLVGSFRRDLIWSVDYPTTDTETVAQIVANILNLTAGNGLGDGTTTTTAS